MAKIDLKNKTLLDYTDDELIISKVVGYAITKEEYSNELKTFTLQSKMADIAEYAELIKDNDLLESAVSYLKQINPDIYDGVRVP